MAKDGSVEGRMTHFVVRWNRGFQKELFGGRDPSSAFFRSEAAISNPRFWTVPEVVKGDNTLETAPFSNVLRMRNSKDGRTVDELYMGIPSAFHHAKMCFKAKLPSPTGKDQLWMGIEANSGGFIAALCCERGQWKLRASDWEHAVVPFSRDVTLRNPDVYAPYVLVYDPPCLNLYEPPAGNPTGEMTLSASLDLVGIQGAGTPFFANEQASGISEFRVGGVIIYEVSPSVIERRQTWANPGSNPTLSVNVAGRSHVGIWARSITAGRTVKVSMSQDGATWRPVENLATALLEGVSCVSKVLLNAFRYIKVEVDESGTGIEIIEISASPY